MSFVRLGSTRTLRRLAAAVVLFAGAACAGEKPPVVEGPARNLVVVCIDTLRAGHVGAYGYERETTPTIDRLAADGALFERVWAQSNWTVPATASLLTGLYPSQHGAGIDGEVRALDEAPPVIQIRPDVETLPLRLADAGFRTGLFSANPFLFGRFKSGFDDAQVGPSDAGSLTTAALDWLDGAAGERFFLHLQYMDIHGPLEPPAPYFGMFRTPAAAGEREKKHGGWSFSQLGGMGGDEDPAFRSFRAHRTALYDGALRYVDDQVQRVLEYLEGAGLADSTLVVVTSDHGDEFWEHALVEASLGGDPRDIWGIGHGHSMFEEVLRLPLILAGPGVPSGVRSACPSRQIDVLPTVLDLLGLPAIEQVSGRSLVPSFPPRHECPEVPIVAESPAYGPDSQAVIWRGRKLIVRSDGKELLYDLRDDPGERRNLAPTARPSLLAGLRRILDEERSGRGDAEAGESLPIDEETLRELRALGYIR